MSEPGASAEDAHALIGAYVLDALDDDERAAFERHLAACPDCRAELPGLQASAARVAASAYVAPPGRMKVAVLEAVGRTRQLPPRVAVDLPVTRRRTWVTGLLAACAALVVLAVAGTAVGFGVAYEHERSRSAQLAALLAHPERTAYASVPGGGTAVVALAHGRAAVRMTASAPLPAQRTYELWVLPQSGNPRPAGLMPSGGGSALVDNVSGAKALAVTVEPSGGSRQPTTAPIVVVPV